MCPGDALHHPPDSLIVREVLVAVALVDRGDDGAVEPDSGDREAPVLSQVGEVGGHKGR